MIRRPEDIEQIVNEAGFLPFFMGEIDGFSIEEHVDRRYWFPDNSIEGVWEWKGQVILEGDCAYGKFYQNKACYISMEWFPDFINYRRSLYQPTTDEQLILQTLKEHESLISKELKRLCGYVKRRQPKMIHIDRLLVSEAKEVTKLQAKVTTKQKRESFDTAITRLQMGGQILIADFEYLYDKQGKRYGWGLARYCTPENFFGVERFQIDRTPEESKQRIVNHLKKILPYATEKQIQRIIG